MKMPIGTCWIGFTSRAGQDLYMHVHGYEHGFIALQWPEFEPWPDYWKEENNIPEYLSDLLDANQHTDRPVWINLNLIHHIKKAKS